MSGVAFIAQMGNFFKSRGLLVSLRVHSKGSAYMPFTGMVFLIPMRPTDGYELHFTGKETEARRDQMGC